jgi:hypothetical protein
VTAGIIKLQCPIVITLRVKGTDTHGVGYYDHERRQFGAWLVARGRRIGAFLTERQRETPQHRAEVLLREYGAAGLVDNEPITARNFA